jgi:hypothetical protein
MGLAIGMGTGNGLDINQQASKIPRDLEGGVVPGTRGMGWMGAEKATLSGQPGVETTVMDVSSARTVDGMTGCWNNASLNPSGVPPDRGEGGRGEGRREVGDPSLRCLRTCPGLGGSGKAQQARTPLAVVAPISGASSRYGAPR